MLVAECPDETVLTLTSHVSLKNYAVDLSTRGSAPQRRLERDPSFRRAAVDAKAAVYVRVPSNG